MRNQVIKGGDHRHHGNRKARAKDEQDKEHHLRQQAHYENLELVFVEKATPYWKLHGLLHPVMVDVA